MLGSVLISVPMPRCVRHIALALRAVVALALCAVVALALSVGIPVAARADTEFLSGRFLVAEPSMPDPRFAETVILMISHDAGGAAGLIVNRRLGEIGIADLLTEFGKPSEDLEGTIGLYYGGPVEPGLGFILHSADLVPDISKPVGADFAVTGQMDFLTMIAGGTGPKDSLVALGYAGWGPGQLESEMQRKDWFAAPADPDLVFTDDPAGTWQRVMDRRGVDL